jgi:hypothetical protein
MALYERRLSCIPNTKTASEKDISFCTCGKTIDDAA